MKGGLSLVLRFCRELELSHVNQELGSSKSWDGGEE